MPSTILSKLEGKLKVFSSQEVRSPKFHDFSSAVPEDKFTSCSHGEDETSLFDFSSEDIEKRRNVSFSHQNYTGHVSLVVNLASF